MVTMLLAVAGSAYSLFWSALAHHGWQSYSDLWNSAGLALSVGHGHWSAVYAPSSQLDSPPGFEYLLVPVMVVGHAHGLGTTLAEGNGFKAFGLILAAVATVMGGSVLFALDAVARSWDYSDAKRLTLCVMAGLGVVSAAVFWGHPEDCIALRVGAVGGLGRRTPADRRAGPGRLAARDRRGLSAPGAAGGDPVVARFTGAASRWWVWRLALPSAVVLLPELVASTARTLHAVVDQPYFPPGESSTPFSHLARYLGHGMYSGGTLRLVATIIAVVLGWVACRQRHDLATVLFVMALAFTLRVVFESELLGFYFYPVSVSDLPPADHAPELVAPLRAVRRALGGLPGARQPTAARHHPLVAHHHADHDRDGRAGLSGLAQGDVDRAEVPHLSRREGQEPSVTISHVRLLPG